MPRGVRRIEAAVRRSAGALAASRQQWFGCAYSDARWGSTSTTFNIITCISIYISHGGCRNVFVSFRLPGGKTARAKRSCANTAPQARCAARWDAMVSEFDVLDDAPCSHRNLLLEFALQIKGARRVTSPRTQEKKEKVGDVGGPSTHLVHPRHNLSAPISPGCVSKNAKRGRSGTSRKYIFIPLSLPSSFASGEVEGESLELSSIHQQAGCALR